MDIESARNDVKQEQLQVEETEDSCVLEYFEIVPLARDTDHNYSRVCVSEDLSDEVKQENLTDVKQEPDDVRSGFHTVSAHTHACTHTHTLTHLTSLFRDYPGEPVAER